ncbi:MAG: hypothetical protein E7347_02680 [Clostridiales bacterium]|nr:hypothetical protein [Clostridiales bacterium]
MNEKLQYASMLEIPVSTCNVSVKPAKKRLFSKKKKVNHEQVKEQLVKKVNQLESDGELAVQLNDKEQNAELVMENQVNLDSEQQLNLTIEEDKDENSLEEQTAQVFSVKQKKNRGKFKISVIGVQFAIISVLLATIFLTNALFTDSGINVFLRSVFGTEKTQITDSRIYADFSPVIKVDDGATLSLDENGVMTFSGKGSVYSPCDGVVTALNKGEDGKFTLEITHNENFKSVLSGIEYAYAGINDTVYHNVPVGYVNSQVTMCFTGGNGAVISNYQIIDDTVVWAV